MKFLEITRKILKAPYSEGGYYLDKACSKFNYFDQPRCRKAFSKSICMSCNQGQFINNKNGSLKKFDLS